MSVRSIININDDLGGGGGGGGGVILTPVEISDPYIVDEIIINGKNYEDVTQCGLVLSETLNEELDSMSLIINNIARTTFEPFEDVTVTFTNEVTMTFYVNTYVENVINAKSNLYSYSIELISRTKILERVILPNLKIRKNLSGNIKTIGYYIRNVVAPHIYKQFPFLILDNAYDDLTMECPEIEWNHPTAKQVINDLLSTIEDYPKLCKVKGNKVSFIELNIEGHDISSLDKALDENHQEMQNHANNIIVDTQNVIPDTSIPNGKMYLTARANGSAILSTDNADIIIPNAKLESVNRLLLNKVYVKFVSPGPIPIGGGSPVSELDISSLPLSKYVVEKSVYDSLPSSVVSNPSHPERYKQWYLYFEQGGNTIGGMNENSSWFLTIPSANIWRVINLALKEYLDARFSAYAVDYWTPNDVRDMVFFVEYCSSNDARTKVVKNKEESKDVSFYQQQQQGLIDYPSFIRSTLEDVNRMGNEEKIIDAIVPLNKIPELGDYIGEYILCKREVAFYKDFAIFKGYLTKKYIKKVKFYGVTNRQKYTQLAQANEMVTREEFNYKKIIFTFDSNFYSNNLSEFMVNYFDNSKPCNISEVQLWTNAMVSNVALVPQILIGEKTLTMTCECYDNYSVGLKVTEDDGQQIQDYVPYVDSNGEINHYYLYFYTGYSGINATNLKEYPETPYGNHQEFYIDNPLYKDNGERLKFTTQFDFRSADSCIVIGKGIAQANSLFSSVNKGGVKLLLSSSRIDEDYPMYPTDATENHEILYALGTNNVVSNITTKGVTIGSAEVINYLNSHHVNSISFVVGSTIILAINRLPNNGELKTTFYIRVVSE